LNDWLGTAAERSLGAVYDHIPQNETADTKSQLLKVVAGRLFLGYSVRGVTFEGGDAYLVELDAASLPPDWSVSLIAPNLSAPVDGWFESDIAGMPSEIESLMAGVPMEALSWGDIDLRDRIEGICAERLPGWRASLMIHGGTGGAETLEVSFTPEQPLTLAVTSRINSSSIPVMLHSSLRDDLLRGFAPVIGIPVPWLELHRDGLIAMSRGILKEEYLVEVAKAEPEVTATTGTVSALDIELESGRYAAWVWMAVYAGTEDRFPEAGLHFGRRALIMPGWEVELYSEFILALDGFDLETRLGAKWSPWRNAWIGGEWSSADDLWWVRLAFDSRIHRPYAWLRFSEDSDTNGAVGLRINDFLSIELHYDSRDGDPWNVRALVNL
jgi:hypothetical protein